MILDVSDEESHKAKIPHEIFLANLIGNHILWFIASLGLAGSYWQPLALVPIVSFSVLIYILWRAKRSKTIDSWYVMCHWQICAKRARIILYMLFGLIFVAFLGWLGFTYMGMMEVAVYAMIGGMGVLPVMVTVLVLIVMEQDIMHQAAQKKLPDSIVEAFPNPGVRVLDEAPVPEA
ncbi:MAG: hypothetical protein RPU64_05135 [Candidatus Sedimenticola sp. (ex Thyasira tokunagai)]